MGISLQISSRPSGRACAGLPAAHAPLIVLKIYCCNPAPFPLKMRQLMAMSRFESSTVEFAPAPAVPRPRLGKLCVAIQGSTPAEMWERAAAAAEVSKFLEFRLDALAKPAAALQGCRSSWPRTAMCRRSQPAGASSMAATSKDRWRGAGNPAKSREAGCSLVDLEVESAEEAKAAQLAKFRAALRAAGTALLISFHDFTRTKGWSRRRIRSKPSNRIS